MSILPAVGRKLADRRDQTTSVAGGFKITDTGPARRRHDPGNVRAQDRQELCLEPGAALEPGIVAPGGAGHGHETWMIRRAIDVAPTSDRFAQTLADKFRAKMPFLRVLPNEQNELQIGESRKHSLAPQFGAFAARRQVAALDVEAGEAEAHGRHGHDLRIVEHVLSDPEPAAQPDARRVRIGTARGMDADAWRLAGDADARGGRGLEDGPWRVRQRSAISRRVPADPARPNLFDERRE